MQGPLREDFARISTRSTIKDLYRIMHGPLREEFSRISTRARPYNENAAGSLLENPQRRLCEPVQSASTRTHHKSHFMREFKGKMPGPKIATHSIYRNNAGGQNRDTQFALACGRYAHGHRTRQFYARNYRQKAGSQIQHPDQAPAFTPTVRTPQCGHTWTKYRREPQTTYSTKNCKPIMSTTKKTRTVFEMRLAVETERKHCQ